MTRRRGGKNRKRGIEIEHLKIALVKSVPGGGKLDGKTIGMKEGTRERNCEKYYETGRKREQAGKRIISVCIR